MKLLTQSQSFSQSFSLCWVYAFYQNKEREKLLGIIVGNDFEFRIRLQSGVCTSVVKTLVNGGYTSRLTLRLLESVSRSKSLHYIPNGLEFF